MHILYISEDYPYTKVHHELCNHLISAGTDVSITLYSVIRKKGLQVRDLRSSYDKNYDTIYYDFEDNLLRYKFDFSYKIKKKYDYLRQFDLSEISIVHAATLFSEGAVAYQLYKERGIPYIVSIRGTDINFYFKYMFHLWKLGLNILRNASKIIFITEQSYNSFFNLGLIKRFQLNFRNKSYVIPNGVDDFWLNNVCLKKNNHNYKFIYIGVFDENKNVVSVMRELLKLSKLYPNLELYLVGGGGNQHNCVLDYCSLYPHIFHYMGKIYEKDKLCNLIRQCDVFTMVSHSETFGLVYIEALSQGLPILYTLGQGIDGVFKENVGVGVVSTSSSSIYNGLLKIIKEYDSFVIPKLSILKKFSWKNIAQTYLNNIVNL